MIDVIRCPQCGAENSRFARFMKLSRCRQCGHDLELVEISEALRQGGVLQGQSDLYAYTISRERADFAPRGLLLAPPLHVDMEHRGIYISGDIATTQGVPMLWKRLTGEREKIGFEQIACIKIVYQLVVLSREKHPYQHHWDVALILQDGRGIPLGRISAERQFPGPVRSHLHASRLAHALHELAGWPVEQRDKVSYGSKSEK